MNRAAAHPDTASPGALRLSGGRDPAAPRECKDVNDILTKRPRRPRGREALPANLTPLLSKQQLAAWLNVSERTIDRWEAEGLLPEPAVNVTAGRTGRACKRWDPVAVAKKLHQ